MIRQSQMWADCLSNCGFNMIQLSASTKGYPWMPNLDELGCPAAVASVAVESRRLKVSLSHVRAEKIPWNFGLQLPGITVEGSEHDFVVCRVYFRLTAHASPVAIVYYPKRSLWLPVKSRHICKKGIQYIQTEGFMFTAKGSQRATTPTHPPSHPALAKCFQTH